MIDATGALFVSIEDNHAVSVIGIRRNGPRVEFGVANSMPTHWPHPSRDGEIVWVDSMELLQRIDRRQKNESISRKSTILVSWEKLDN